MNNSGIFNLNRTAILAGIISASFSLHAMASAGKVEFALGGANLLRNDGSSRQISKGDEINPGDTIKTTDGRVQVRFSDGGYMSFQPNTEFKVEDYSYSGKTDGTEKAFFRLIAGGLRAITGVVGHANKPNYKVSTPVATIGIRGSEYFANYNGKLTAHCNHGSIYVANDQGNLILFRGQTAVVANGAPSYGDNTEGVGARGPTNTNTAYQQQNNDSNTNNLFRTGDLRNEDGTLKALGDVGDIGVAYTNYYSGAEGGSYSNYSVLDGTYLETDKTSLVKDPSGNLASITNTYTQSYDGSESLKTVRTDTNFSGDQIKGSNGGISWVRVDGSVTITNTYYWSGSSTPDYSYSGTVNNPQYIFGNLTPLQDMNNLVLAQYVATYNYAGGTSPVDSNGVTGTLNALHFDANFGTRSIENGFISVTHTALGSGPVTASFDGGIYTAASGAVTLPKFTASETYSGTTVNINGFFSGHNAAQAGLSYIINGEVTGVAALNGSAKQPQPQ